MLHFCPRLMRRLVVALVGGVLLAALTPMVAPVQTAWADTGGVFAPVAWKSYPASDSVEMGDHALNLNFNFGSPNNTVSSAAHNLKNGITGTPSGYTVLLRTSSDGATQKLPPTPTSITRLSSVRVGLTPTSTIVQGVHAWLRLDAQVTKPYLPSASIGELNSRISNSPFMYLRMQVTNISTSTKPASALYVGFGSACGPVMDDYPVSGWRTLRLCNRGDRGGFRYLSAPKLSGSSWGIGSDTVADFAADGALGGGGSSGKAAVALPVLALAGGARHSLTLVYGAWNDQAGITSTGGSRYHFYYRTWHAGPAAMLRFAIDNQAGALDGSVAFDALVRAVSSDASARFAAVHGFRGWRHANWLVEKPNGDPFYAVTEGAFNYLSTLDVGYEYHLLQTRYEPWKSKLELDQWAAHYELDDAGRKFMLHDLGKDEQLTVGRPMTRRSATSTCPSSITWTWSR
jgi:Glycosyl hydrolase family 52